MCCIATQTIKGLRDGVKFKNNYVYEDIQLKTHSMYIYILYNIYIMVKCYCIKFLE